MRFSEYPFIYMVFFTQSTTGAKSSHDWGTIAFITLAGGTLAGIAVAGAAYKLLGLLPAKKQ